ncbi:hypothetical protein [Kitasatospora sp. MBT63]|uniref:hypothetical protein n=1 Tax=Kitasatospora sp. MBT63 TaxID=1444768 RepID=UPI0011EA7022|nr:hypothetical protein [Kitasatospora sp. MBT63]
MEQVWGLTEYGGTFDESMAEKVNECISWESAQAQEWENQEAALFLIYCISGEGFYSAAELDAACTSMKPLTYTCEKCAAVVAAVDWILRTNGKRTPDAGPSKPSWLPSSIWGWQTVGTPKVASYTPSDPIMSSALTYITQNICPHFVNSEKAFLADLEIPEDAMIGEDDRSARLDNETSNIFTTIADYSKLPMSCWLGYREKMVAYFELNPRVFEEEAPPVYPPLQEVPVPEYVDPETVRVPDNLRKAEREWKLREGVRNLDMQSEMSRDPDKYRAAARELKIEEKRKRQQKEKADREKREKAKARREEVDSAAWAKWAMGLKEADGGAEIQNIPPGFEGVTDGEVDEYYKAIGKDRPAREGGRYPGSPSGDHLLISRDVWQDIIEWKESPVYVMLISNALKILKPPNFSKYEVVAERNPMVKSALKLISDNWNSFLPMEIYDKYLAGMDQLFQTVDKLSYLDPRSDEDKFQALLGRGPAGTRVMVQKTLKDLDDYLVKATRAGFDRFLAKIAEETKKKESFTLLGFDTGISTTPEATDVVNKKLLPKVKARFNQRLESFAETANIQHERLNKRAAPPAGSEDDPWGA